MKIFVVQIICHLLQVTRANVYPWNISFPPSPLLFIPNPKHCSQCKLLLKNLLQIERINNHHHLLFSQCWKQQKHYNREVKFPEYILLNENQIHPELINNDRWDAHCAQRKRFSSALKGALLTNYTVIIRTCWSQGLMTRRVWLFLCTPWPISSQQAPSYSSSGNCIVLIGILNCIWEQSLQVYG